MEDSAHKADDKLQRQMDDVDRAEQRERVHEKQQRHFQKRMMREAVGRLYEDKPAFQAPAADAAGQDEKRPLPTVLQTPAPSVGRWIGYYFANALLFVCRWLTKND